MGQPCCRKLEVPRVGRPPLSSRRVPLPDDQLCDSSRGERSSGFGASLVHVERALVEIPQGQVMTHSRERKRPSPYDARAAALELLHPRLNTSPAELLSYPDPWRTGPRKSSLKQPLGNPRATLKQH